MHTDKRLTATVPLIGATPEWDTRYLEDCVRMGADSAFLMAPYDNIVRSRIAVRLSAAADTILPPAPEQRVCDTPSLELVAHWADIYRELAPQYRARGVEPYFWLCRTIGHGGELSTRENALFQNLMGASGEEAPGCYCPLDENFRQYLLDALTLIAKTNVPLILLDDDFRLNYHMPAVDIGCFCPLHVALFNEQNNTDYTREALAGRVMQNIGGTRARFMRCAGGSLLAFAADIEKAVHAVSPQTRIGLATGMMHFSTEGCELKALARNLAGNTRPYVRLFGAPYHVKNNLSLLGFTVEYARVLQHHLDDGEIELIGEGDTYPHTRFFTSKTALRSYLIASRMAGIGNMLHYPFPFSASPSLEPLYVETAAELRPLMAALDAILTGSETPLGIAPLLSFHNFTNIPLTPDMTKRERIWPDEPVALKMLSQFGIPAALYDEDGAAPIILAGYNAYGCSDTEIARLLDRGAIVDATAAAWLLERGHDIGLAGIITLPRPPAFERYESDRFSPRHKGEQIWLLCPAHTPFFAVHPGPKAEAAGRWIDGGTGESSPSAVVYENGKRRVFTLGFDFYGARGSFQAINNLARAEQLRRVCGWLGVAPLVESDVFVYALAYKQGNERIVCLFNFGADKCHGLTLRLGKQPIEKPEILDISDLAFTPAPDCRVTGDPDGYALQCPRTLDSGMFLVARYVIREE